MSELIVISALILGILGLIMGFGLAFAYKVLAVKDDPKLGKILDILPGANCGACGFAGCHNYAEELIGGKAKTNLCSPGGEEVNRKIAETMGVEPEIREKEIALVRCRGGYNEAREKFAYQGITDCRAVSLVAGGKKGCEYGCLGLGTCVKSCPFDAIRMGDNGLPVIDEDKCVGCGRCVNSCPRKIIALSLRSQRVFVLCLSQDKGKPVKEVCQVGCIGCGLCVKVCPVQAITMENNLPRINPELCVACGECVKKCPTHSIWFTKDIAGRNIKNIPVDKLVQSIFEFKKEKAPK